MRVKGVQSCAQQISARLHPPLSLNALVGLEGFALQ